MTRFAMVGAGGHARVAADAANATGILTVSDFFDDAPLQTFASSRCKPSGTVADLLQTLRAEDSLFVGIGNNQIREKLFLRLSGASSKFVVIVHPSAVVSEFAVLEKNALVLAGAVINCDSRIGLGAIVNTGATIDHDCQLAEFCHISPGAHLAGGVTVGKRSWVGIGASIREGVVIGDDCIIGAGAAVVSDVPSGAVYVGVPAKPLLKGQNC